jgi:hypothetical protein
MKKKRERAAIARSVCSIELVKVSGPSSKSGSALILIGGK